MAKSYDFGTRVVTNGSPDVVYRLLAEATSWRDWAGPLVTRSRWEVEPDARGLGGRRRLGRPLFMVREEITAAEPPRRHAYRMLSGQPVRSYRAEVHISPVASPVSATPSARDTPTVGAAPGTLIEWTGTVVPLLPGTGRLTSYLLGRMVHGFATRLAEAAG